MDSELFEEIKKHNGVIEGHFIGASGKHLSVYLAKDNIFPNTTLASKIGQKIAEVVKEDNPEIVVGPVTSGIIIAQWTAFHLSDFLKKNIPAVFTDEINDKQVFKRGYASWVQGKRVVVVEDVVNTAKSIHEVVEEVCSAGGNIIQVISIFNRGSSDEEVSEKLNAPYRSLIHFPLEAYSEDEVPEWLQKIPISTEYGHGGNNAGKKDN